MDDLPVLLEPWRGELPQQNMEIEITEWPADPLTLDEEEANVEWRRRSWVMKKHCLRSRSYVLANRPDQGYDSEDSDCRRRMIMRSVSPSGRKYRTTRLKSFSPPSEAAMAGDAGGRAYSSRGRSASRSATRRHERERSPRRSEARAARFIIDDPNFEEHEVADVHSNRIVRERTLETARKGYAQDEDSNETGDELYDGNDSEWERAAEVHAAAEKELAKLDKQYLTVSELRHKRRLLQRIQPDNGAEDPCVLVPEALKKGSGHKPPKPGTLYVVDSAAYRSKCKSDKDELRKQLEKESKGKTPTPCDVRDRPSGTD